MNEGGLLRGVHEKLPVDRQERSYSQPLVRAVVVFVGDGVQLFLAVVRQIGAFGQYWRTRPFLFSLLPRCHGLCGSQKYTAMPVLLVSCLCSAISLPWS